MIFFIKRGEPYGRS